MDETLLMNAGLTTTGVALLLIAYRVFKLIQGKKLVSSCCGRRMEVGIDVLPMTPTRKDIENPLHLQRSETLGLPAPQPAANSSI
jgi:hypothetical protein